MLCIINVMMDALLSLRLVGTYGLFDVVDDVCC